MQHTKFGWILIGVLAVFTAGVAADLPSLLFASESTSVEAAWPDDAEARLRERFEEYAGARVNEDWQALYELAAPEDKARVDLSGFLRFYGHGVLKTHGLTILTLSLDPATRSAQSQVETDAELVPARFPKRMLAGFQMPEDPADLRGTVTSDVGWAYREGAWFFRMENEIVTGVSSSGQQVTPSIR